MDGIMIRKRVIRFSRTGKRARAFALAAALLLFPVLLSLAVRAPLRAAAYEKARDEAVRAVTSAVSSALDAEEGGFLHAENVGGECFIINADTVKLNRLTAAVTETARELLLRNGSIGVSVDLGTASGIAILSGSGPSVGARFTPLGTVTAEPVSSLRSSGINQSLFKLELRVTARVLVMLAGSDEEMEIKTTVPIAETVVVGRVPQVYTNVASEEDLLNLIPNEAP